ncbi:hypothetical protein NHX12_002990 [Muraenolepis orangiensis]|uniref:Uncharacterized protein n=1 Tax=Muraenolepis orangiensis TaxID=630683 RepID=A0A9Q0E0I0_9TELE|nr:hypothetical protein NHX12_002990 [Muraenolepis orangiensis]
MLDPVSNRARHAWPSSSQSTNSPLVWPKRPTKVQRPWRGAGFGSSVPLIGLPSPRFPSVARSEALVKLLDSPGRSDPPHSSGGNGHRPVVISLEEWGCGLALTKPSLQHGGEPGGVTPVTWGKVQQHLRRRAL